MFTFSLALYILSTTWKLWLCPFSVICALCFLYFSRVMKTKGLHKLTTFLRPCSKAIFGGHFKIILCLWTWKEQFKLLHFSWHLEILLQIVTLKWSHWLGLRNLLLFVLYKTYIILLVVNLIFKFNLISIICRFGPLGTVGYNNTCSLSLKSGLRTFFFTILIAMHVCLIVKISVELQSIHQHTYSMCKEVSIILMIHI